MLLICAGFPASSAGIGKGPQAEDHAADHRDDQDASRWLSERGGHLGEPLFPTSQGRPLSHDAREQRLAKHAAAATELCSSMRGKKVTQHVLRHTAAMRLLKAGIDTTVIALWLGQQAQVETTQVYVHADLAIKQRALARTAP
jgi:site-specific recombinase XerD